MSLIPDIGSVIRLIISRLNALESKLDSFERRVDNDVFSRIEALENITTIHGSSILGLEDEVLGHSSQIVNLYDLLGFNTSDIATLFSTIAATNSNVSILNNNLVYKAFLADMTIYGLVSTQVQTIDLGWSKPYDPKNLFDYNVLGRLIYIGTPNARVQAEVTMFASCSGIQTTIGLGLSINGGGITYSYEYLSYASATTCIMITGTFSMNTGDYLLVTVHAKDGACSISSVAVEFTIPRPIIGTDNEQLYEKIDIAPPNYIYKNDEILSYKKDINLKELGFYQVDSNAKDIIKDKD